MQCETAARRSFLLSGLALAGGVLLAGCDSGSNKEIEVTKQENPADKAKASMDFMKKNMGKKSVTK